MSYTLSKEYVWKLVGEKAVILHLDSGNYYSLNDSASLIWQGIMEKLSIDQIADKICTVFDVDKTRATSDIEQITAQFLEKKTILHKV